VAPNQGKRGIGRALVRACEAAVAAQVSFYFRIGN
jgi:predicted N-acetyltransferase YhbS